MSLLIKYLLTTYKDRSRKNQVSGFTMIELLIATIMSFLIITPILAFAVSIINDDVKEQAKASTELELQSAMDYIQQDISQAYYIYDGLGVKTIKDRLYYGANGAVPTATNIPVLVFWKRELVTNAIDVTATPNTVCGDELDTNGKCDDTYVDSLVAYYLVPETSKDSKWCQPGGTSTNCPSRIERWSIRDGVKKSDGTYICGTEGRDAACSNYKESFKRSLGMPYTKADGTLNGTKFSFSTPNTWMKSTEAYNTTPQVLVNYISKGDVTPITNQCRNALGIPTTITTPVENDLRIGVTDYANPNIFKSFYGCVNSAGNIAQINIRGDALRRNEPNNVDCAKQPNYCPSVTGQIGGRSGFGQ